jgi:hypothetical protein
MIETAETGRPAWRKIAREAVIFALLGWPTACLIILIVLLVTGAAHSTTDWLMVVPIGGLVGLSGGLGIWILYRLIRFAVKG